MFKAAYQAEMYSTLKIWWLPAVAVTKPRAHAQIPFFLGQVLPPLPLQAILSLRRLPQNHQALLKSHDNRQET